MPFKSKAQAKYLFANHPKVAKEFATMTPNMSALPSRVKKSKGRAKKGKQRLMLHQKVARGMRS